LTSLRQRWMRTAQTVSCHAWHHLRKVCTWGWLDGLAEKATGGSCPGSVLGLEREMAVDVHQACAGHWSRTGSYLHRIGKATTAACAGCSDIRRPGAVWALCESEADTPRHVIMAYLALAATRAAVLCVHIHYFK
jgi:hypothetical protein